MPNAGGARNVRKGMNLTMGTVSRPCRYCGRQIIWTTNSAGKRIPLENALTPYKQSDKPNRALYTGGGTKILCETLPEGQEAEAEGFAHEYHFCPKKPTGHGPRPLTRRERLETMGYYEYFTRRVEIGADVSPGSGQKEA